MLTSIELLLIAALLWAARAGMVWLQEASRVRVQLEPVVSAEGVSGWTEAEGDA